MGGGKELPEAPERRRQERDLFWEQRDADHARAMALDQAQREKRQYHAAPENIEPVFKPRRRRARRGPVGRVDAVGDGDPQRHTMQERTRQRI